MLAINNVEVVYDNVVLVLKGVSLCAEQGRSRHCSAPTELARQRRLRRSRASSTAERGQVTKARSSSTVHGSTACAARGRQCGVAQVFEGRRVFENLTVEENLVAGGHLQTIADSRHRHGPVYRLFPALKSVATVVRISFGRRAADAGDRPCIDVATAADSARRTVAWSRPAESSMRSLASLPACESEGMTVLLVEQNAALALEIADYGYVMENGRIVLDGPADTLRQNSDVREFYLGLNELGARKSYREVKHYRRRKRWLS